MNKLLQSFETARLNTPTLTANGAITHSTANTGQTDVEAVLDFYSHAGSLRGNKERALELFEQAFSGNKLFAVRALFNLRNPRHGNGERDLFRFVLVNLARWDDELVASIVQHIPEMGRWDDLFCLIQADGVPLSATAALNAIHSQYIIDIAHHRRDGEISLLAKWLPRQNRRKTEAARKANALAKFLAASLAGASLLKTGNAERDYRKTVAALSARANIVEQMISEKRWGDINYASLPSKAHSKYRAAFERNDGKRYAAYLTSVEKGAATIKSTSLTPVEMIRDFNNGGSRTIEAQWNDAVAKFTSGRSINVLPVVDVSSSMGMFGYYGSGMFGYYGSHDNIGPRPIDVSISLGAFFAQANNGAFKDYFMTFETCSKLVSMADCQSLSSRIKKIQRAAGDMGNTNIQSVYKLILEHAQASNAPQSDMPEVIIILSDMQFNYIDSRKHILDDMRQKYTRAGYNMPFVIFWNLNGQASTSPVKAHDDGTMLLTGFSQAVLKPVLNMDIETLNNFTPLAAMLTALTSAPYDQINF